MRQIAAEVGVQVGALYNYIPDKQTLLFELMRDHMRLLLDSQPQNAHTDPVAGLRDFLRFHIHFHHDRPDAVFIAYMELRNLEPENFRVIEQMRGEYEKRLLAIIEEGCRQRVFQVEDGKIATLAIIAMLTGVSVWFREGGRLTLTEVEACYRDLVQRALGLVDPEVRQGR